MGRNDNLPARAKSLFRPGNVRSLREGVYLGVVQLGERVYVGAGGDGVCPPPSYSDLNN